MNVRGNESYINFFEPPIMGRPKLKIPNNTYTAAIVGRGL